MFFLRGTAGLNDLGLCSRYRCLQAQRIAACLFTVCLTAAGTRQHLWSQEPTSPSKDSAPIFGSSTGDRGNVTESKIVEFRSAELASVDQLVLMLSNATDPKGQRQEVLVFLGRTNNRGWETVGVSDNSELNEHWRNVAKRQLAPYQQAGLTSEQLDKVNLAVEVSIAQFQRLYNELRSDFLEQPDQKSRLEVLAGDNRYEKLRKLGREGLFINDSLVAKVVNRVLSDSKLQQP